MWFVVGVLQSLKSPKEVVHTHIVQGGGPDNLCHTFFEGFPSFHNKSLPAGGLAACFLWLGNVESMSVAANNVLVRVNATWYSTVTHDIDWRSYCFATCRVPLPHSCLQNHSLVFVDASAIFMQFCREARTLFSCYVFIFLWTASNTMTYANTAAL